MSEIDKQWAERVCQNVQSEYPQAKQLAQGESSGNVVIDLRPGDDSGHVFKALSPSREKFLLHEKRLHQSLRDACGQSYTELLVPVQVTTIGGEEGFASPRFEHTLLDLIWSDEAENGTLLERMATGLVQAMERLDLLRKCTTGAFDSRFVEELRITIEYFRQRLDHEKSEQLRHLDQITCMIERFLPR